MARAILGAMLPGRYPRWGYLDRLETNAIMPRACVTTLIGCGALALGAFLAGPLRPLPTSPPERVRPFHGQEIRILPQPLPPPPPVVPAPRLEPVMRRAAVGEIRPVDDALALDRVDVGAMPGAGGAPGNGDPGNEAWSDGRDTRPFVLEPALPRVDAFVAVEHEPELVFMQRPEYPEIARDAGIEGSVLVRVLVAADGTVRQATVLRGVTGLDEAALAAVATAVFRPARQQGLPVAVWVIVPIQFSLRP